MDKFTKKIFKILIGYATVLVLIVVVFKTVWRLDLISSVSMESTIMTGDIVFGTRYGIGEEDIERYDILVFAPPDEPEMTYIKRLIGLPGEIIEVKDGKVYADGIELDDSFVQNPMNRKGDGIYEVPKGCYFFLGDNRNCSKDSRFWQTKYVPLESITGKAKFVLFPFKDYGNIKYKS